MTTPRPSRASPQVTSAVTTYQVTVAGHLDDHWADWLGGHSLTRNADASTTLRFRALDQTHLHGVLSRIRDIGVDLLALHPADDLQGPAPTLGRPLRTARLTLRPATEYDADAAWTYRRLDSVNEWLTGVPDEFEEYRPSFVEPSRLAATVIVELAARDQDPQDPEVVGDFMLRVEDAWSQVEVTDRAKNAQAELGWVLDPAHTGHGYATEAVRELLRYCFEELRVHRVVANCFLENDASWRLMEKVGMRRETYAVGESLHRSGQWLDTVGYAVLAHEWKQSYAASEPENLEQR